MAQSFSQKQLDSLVVIERASAILSLVGTMLVIGTFCASRTFRTLANTLIFYASFGNILSNVAHLVAVDGVTAGPNSALCQMQGFLQQMFMPADSLWSLAMATNVYLAFFHHYESEALRKLHWKYFVTCYGVPFIPAIIYLFVKNPKGERIYGGATLWCWISNDWQPLRVATYYGPIWFIMLFIFAIYTRVGRKIYQKRRELQTIKQTSSTVSEFRNSQFVNAPANKEHLGIDPTGSARISSNAGISRNDRIPEDAVPNPNRYYSIQISSSSPTTAGVTKPGGPPPPPHINQLHLGMDRVIIAYTKCAVLFAASLLITWVPSSANRVYSLLYPTRANYALNVAAALVLPLQGFWNAVIYFVTSFSACRTVYATLGANVAAGFCHRGRETDSTMELAGDYYGGGATAIDFEHRKGPC